MHQIYLQLCNRENILGQNATKGHQLGANFWCFLSDDNTRPDLWTSPRRNESRMSGAIPVSLQAHRDAPHSNYDHSDLDTLKVSQLKQVLDLGGVDYRDCLEKRELVDRLIDTQDYIPRAAQHLLQLYLSGHEPTLDLDSPEFYPRNNSILQKEEGAYIHMLFTLTMSRYVLVDSDSYYMMLDWWLEAERNTIKVFQEASSSVVNITTSNEVALNTMDVPRGTGSGFVWDKDGHIVTNYHVIMNGNRARVTLADTTTWDASVVGVAKNKDLAVIKIAAPSSKLKPVSVGTSQV